MKRLNYPYCHLLPPTAGYPPLLPSTTGHHQTTAGHCLLPLPSVGPPMVFLKINKIFLRIQSIYQTLKKYMSGKVIPRDNISWNKISGNKNSNLLPNAPLRVCFTIRVRLFGIILANNHFFHLKKSVFIYLDNFLKIISKKSVFNFFNYI